jgi:hypothetical protein
MFKASSDSDIRAAQEDLYLPRKEDVACIVEWSLILLLKSHVLLPCSLW